MKNTLSPSILSVDFSAPLEHIRKAEEAGATDLHFDVMDGCFVPNISFGAPVIKALRKHSGSFFDVHMMVENPERYIPEMAEAGADRITIHQEATRHLDRAVQLIREQGKETGVALNPATSLETLRLLLPSLDYVLIMSVNPGFGGQKLIPYCVEKVRLLRAMAEEQGLHTRIGIDGGVNLSNVREILQAGADYIIAGSACFCPMEKTGENVKEFLRILREEEH